MLILDSSCWLEYFLNGANADHYAPLIEGNEEILVPAIVLHEVFKVVIRSRNEEAALAVAGIMQQHTVIPVNENIAMFSARLGVQHDLAMADSMILATARIHDVALWTQDADFKNLESVKYFEKA